MGQFLAAMCQTTGEQLPAAWMLSRIRIAAAGPLVPVRRGEESGSARVSLAKPGIHHEPSALEIALYGVLTTAGAPSPPFVHAQLRASLDEAR